LRQVRNVLVQNCQPQAETFVAIEGDQSADVALMSNDLRRVRTPFSKAEQFAGEVMETGNLKAK
jgi:hypothetical protein